MTKTTPPSVPDHSPPLNIYSVTRLNREAKSLLETHFPMVWVEGEISNLATPSSGHLYFSLKDAGAQVRCALFRPQQRFMRVAPEDGMQVVVRARVSLYPERGDYQLIIEHLEPAGEGALRRAFDLLKQRLAAEGLFNSARKRPLPPMPKRIGIITSPSGAVIHDILKTLRRRFPAIPILLYPVPVQGEGAGMAIAKMIALAGQRRECDVLILARGGGSLEDLWAFNEEVIARAIVASPLPIICGVGHETDFTIADMAADVRAPTPTAAAELVSPNREEWLKTVDDLMKHLRHNTIERLQGLSQRIDWLAARLTHPRQQLRLIKQQLDSLRHHLALTQERSHDDCRVEAERLHLRLIGATPRHRIASFISQCRYLSGRSQGAVSSSLLHQSDRFTRLREQLTTLNPRATLERGYAIVRRGTDEQIVRQAESLKIGDVVTTEVARGRFQATVSDINED